MEILICILFVLLFFAVFDALRLLVGALILRFNPRSQFGFRLFAGAAASSFGLFSKVISKRCNLDCACDRCRFWTCERYHQSRNLSK